MTLEEKIDDLISLVRALDTKIGFLETDLEDLKESVEQIKFVVEGLEEGGQSKRESDKPRYKVEHL